MRALPPGLRHALRRLTAQPVRFGFWLVGGLVLVAIGSFMLLELNLDQTVLDISKLEAQQMAVRVLSAAVQKNLATDSAQLFKVNVQNGIAFVQPNLPAINTEAARATMAILTGLRHLPDDNIEIPLGQALGSKLLSAYGPMIPVTLIPYGSVSIQYHESFKQAGINQTMLTVYLDTDSTVQIVVPLVSDQVHLNVQVPVAQEWLAGQVPSTVVMTGANPGRIVTLPIGSTSTKVNGAGSVPQTVQTPAAQSGNPVSGTP